MPFYNNTRLAYIYLQSNICLECETCFLLRCTDRPTGPVIISDAPLDSRNLLKALLVVQANNAVRTHISLQCSNMSCSTMNRLLVESKLVVCELQIISSTRSRKVQHKPYGELYQHCPAVSSHNHSYIAYL